MKKILILIICFFFLYTFAENGVLAMEESPSFESDLVINGELILYFMVSYEDFMTREENKIENYKISIFDGDEYVRIAYVAKRKEGERILGGRSSLGRSITYYVSKKDKKIAKWHYHK